MSKAKHIETRFNLSKDNDCIFTLEGVHFVNSDFLTHNELRTLNKLRKKYNYLFKDDLMIAREEAQDEQG